VILPMNRVRILGPRAQLPVVLATLQDLGVLHVAEAPASPQLQTPSPGPHESRRRRQLLRVLDDAEAALRLLEAGDSRVGAPGAAMLPSLARVARDVRRSAESLAARQATLQEEEALLRKYRTFLPAFAALHRVRPNGGRLEVSAYHVVLQSGRVDALPALRAGLKQLLGDGFELLDRPLPGGEIALLLLVPRSRSATVEQLLAETRVQEVPVPAGYGRTFEEAVPRMLAREAELPQELEAVRRERTALARRHGAALRQARAGAHDALARLEAAPRARITAHAFVLEGWVPATSDARLADGLHRACGDLVVVETLAREAWRAEDAPVVLRNPRLFRPFETITRMMPLPRYGSIDPTPYVAVFFPMFFGMMLGDVGYGAALALIAFVLHHRSRPGTAMRTVSEIMGACALFAIAFGMAFGELFGDLGTRWLHQQPLLFDRGEQITAFLGLAVALGFVHVLLGLILGVVAARRHPRQAVGRGLSAVMVMLVLVAILAAVDVLPKGLLTPAAVAILVAFPVLVLLEGLVAPVEFLSTLGHVLSYARIMALGTASVMLAVVANQMVGALGSVVVGVLFGLMFHLVNFALALFSPTIHALRLHYVEFFGTFYSPGGVRYTPLGHWTPATGMTPRA
jgi:V/A-type H+-transporting ATPase subunit I